LAQTGDSGQPPEEVVIPDAAPTPEEIDSLDLGRSAHDTMAELQARWLEWLTAYYRGDTHRAAAALDKLLENTQLIGMQWLPDLSIGVAVKAVEFARDGEFGKAHWGLDAARKFDPELPEVFFAASSVALLEGSKLEAAKHQLRGYYHFLKLPIQRYVLLADLMLWIVCIFLLAGTGFVLLQVAQKGPDFFRGVVVSVARLVPLPVAYLICFATLFWPIVLPSGIFWLLVYWSILAFGSSQAIERVVLVWFWVLIIVAPLAVAVRSERSELAFSPAVRGLESATRRRLSGSVLTDLGELQEALPESIAVRHVLADLQRVVGRWEIARTIYSQVLDAEPENDAAWVDIGACYFYLDDFRQAIESFGRATLSESPNPAGYFNQSQTFSELYRFSESEAALRQAQLLDIRLVGQWISGASAQRIVSLNGGLQRGEEIRRELLGKWKEEEVDLMRETLKGELNSLPLILLFAVVSLALYRVSRDGREGARQGGGAQVGWLESCTHILVPGVRLAKSESWGWAFWDLIIPSTLITLPIFERLGLRLPWGYDPGSPNLAWISFIGLVAYFSLRLMVEIQWGWAFVVSRQGKSAKRKNQ
jgi:tetratricopeptide (TPR) repeat protein